VNSTAYAPAHAIMSANDTLPAAAVSSKASYALFTTFNPRFKPNDSGRLSSYRTLAFIPPSFALAKYVPAS
jgi:hypothetical protein